MLHSFLQLFRPEVPSQGALSPSSEPMPARPSNLDVVVECQLARAARDIHAAEVARVRRNGRALTAQIDAEKAAERAKRERDARRLDQLLAEDAAAWRRRVGAQPGLSIAERRRQLNAAERRIAESDRRRPS